MRKLSIFFSAIAALALASCMDSGYDDVEKDSTGVTINTTNIVSIQQLKETYRSTITGSGMKQITEDIQVKGWVTGNDNGSNLYNEISLQDNSGAIIVAINKGGLAGLLPVGQQVVAARPRLAVSIPTPRPAPRASAAWTASLLPDTT